MIQKIERFSLTERLTHWMVAISFFYALLSGMALWSHRMWWMARRTG